MWQKQKLLKVNTIKIKKAAITDLKSVQEIGRQTFYETFSAVNTEEDMAGYLEKSFSDIQLTKELSDKDSAFYIASDQHRVIGYLKINTGGAQTELKDDNALEIERIYVLQEYHGKKVGQLLYDKAIEVAKQQNSDYVWLGVWEENPRAINFYQKNGFIAFDKHIFRLGDDEQTDIMMKLQLH